MKVYSENEIFRIKFLIRRDGLDSAILTSKQTMKIYRAGVTKSRKRKVERVSHLSVAPFREAAIRSYLQCRNFLANQSDYL